MPFPPFLRTRLSSIRIAGVALLAATGQALDAQNPFPATDGFAPNANDIVTTLALQPDGKILMGGYFTQLHPFGSPVSGNGHIARLNHDGSVDGTFTPNVSDVVRTLVVQPSGQIVIGGQFTTVQPSGGGAAVSRKYAARLNADGSLDAVFNPNPNGVVYAVAVQANGQIIIGGSFTTVQPGGAASPTTRNHIARFNADGSLDTGFDPNANLAVLSLAVEPNGQIVVGGGFSTLQPNGAATATTRNCVARINSDGSLDTGFDPEANGSVMAIAILPNGQIVLGGEFVHFQANGAAAQTQCDFLARLNSDGSLDTGFIVNPLASVTALAVQADGKLLIGGNFTSAFPEDSSGVAAVAYVARVNSDGSLDQNYSPTPNQAVDAIVVQPDGFAVLGGYFTSFQPVDQPSAVPLNFIARVGPDGSVDATLAPDAGGGVFATAVLSNGQMLVGGTFQSLAGITQSFLARLNANGSLDPTFAPKLNGPVGVIALQTDGKILVGGSFTAVDGILRGNVARLNPDGTLDGPFNPNANGKVTFIMPQSNGQILICGVFSGLIPNGVTTGIGINGFARLNSDGSVDLTYNPNPTGGAVFAGVLQSDGKLVVAGEFTSMGGFGRGSVARLNADGTLDTNYNPSCNLPVYALALQSDGKIVIGGSFTGIAPQTAVAPNTSTNTTATYNGQTITIPAPGTSASVPIYINHLARLNTDGTLDTTFFPDPSDIVLALALQPNGSFVVGGTMTSFATNGSTRGTIRNYIGRVGSDGSLDATFDPNANGQVDTITLLSNGQMLVGGTFTTLQPNGATSLTLANHIAILNADGTVNPSFTADVSPTPSGQVNSFALQPSGQLLVGGSFGPMAGVPGSNLIRINPDGAPDGSYNPVFDGPVNAIGVQPNGATVSAASSYALWLESSGAIRQQFASSSNGYVHGVLQQPNGQILICGLFSSFSGATASANLVRLNANGTVDSSFNPNPNGEVDAMVLQPDGKILIGGTFTAIGTTPFQYLARLNSDGTLDATFNPSPDLGVTCIALQSNGQVIAGGNFTSVETTLSTTITTRGYIARFNSDGTLDTVFDPVLNGTPYTIAVLSNGQVLIGGAFQTILPNGTGTAITRSGIARLNADGSVDTAFDPEANASVVTIVVAPNGQLYVGGDFTQFQPNPTYTTTNGVTTASGPTFTDYYLARLNADGTVDTSFYPYPNSSVVTIALQTNGQIIVGGAFTSFNPNGSTISTTRDFIARMSPNGTIDPTFDPGLNSSVNSIAVLQDGSVFVGGTFTAVETGGAVFVGGAFTHVGGLSTPYLVRLNADSTVSGAFAAGPDGVVNALTPQQNGGTLVGGAFNNIGGLPYPKLARLNADSSLDTTFDPRPDGQVNAIAVWPNGEIIIGGSFTSVGGVPVTSLALLTSSGSPVASFAPAINGTVNAVIVLPTGQLVIGGTFTSVDGLAVGGVARLNANGSVDPTFNPNANGAVEALELQVDGTVLVAGAFTAIGGNAISYVARVGANGAVDTTFNLHPNGVVYAVVTQLDGKVVIGGSFTSVGGQSRYNIARVSTPTASTQSLTASTDESTITWTRTGAAPAFAFVSFEESTDGTNFTALGQATSADGMTWQITGVAPTGSTTFYVRAKGIVPTSRYSSSGLVETLALIDVLAGPVITSAPQAAGVAGSEFSFMVTATRSPTSYSASGLPPGLSINKGTGMISGMPAGSGTYTVAVTATGSGGSSTSNLTISIASSGGLTTNASPSNRLLNLSSRDELKGTQILIAGFVIAGSGQENVVLRAVGPGLAAFNVSGVMATPELQLYSSSGAMIAQNSGWGGAGALSASFAQVGAFALSAGSADSAIETSLAPGAYTMQVFDHAGIGGIVLMEIYDASPSPLSAPQRLINISARGAVSPGAGALIGGFVISGGSTKTVLIRGVGPGLAAFGVANTLADPVLTVFDSGGNVVARNLSWSSQTFAGSYQVAGADIASTGASVGAFALAANSADTALVANLPPGAYTFQVTSASNSTGEALGEVYEVP